MIGSLNVFYSPIEKNCARVALLAVVFIFNCIVGFNVGFGLPSLRVSTKGIRLLALGAIVPWAAPL